MQPDGGRPRRQSALVGCKVGESDQRKILPLAGQRAMHDLLFKDGESGQDQNAMNDLLVGWCERPRAGQGVQSNQLRRQCSGNLLDGRQSPVDT